MHILKYFFLFVNKFTPMCDLVTLSLWDHFARSSSFKCQTVPNEQRVIMNGPQDQVYFSGE